MAKFLSIKKSAALLQVSPQTLRQYDTTGTLIPARRVGPRKYRQYTLEQLQEFSFKEWGIDVTKDDDLTPK